MHCLMPHTNTIQRTCTFTAGSEAMLGGEHRSLFHTWRLVLFLSVLCSLKYILQHCDNLPAAFSVCLSRPACAFVCVRGGKRGFRKGGTVEIWGWRSGLDETHALQSCLVLSRVSLRHSPAHSGLSSSKFTAKSCETLKQGRKHHQ